jgi:hypothetical protein
MKKNITTSACKWVKILYFPKCSYKLAIAAAGTVVAIKYMMEQVESTTSVSI